MILKPEVMMLEIPTIIWHSSGDEESFFRWLYSIPGYVTCEGRGQVLYVTFSLRDATRESTQELVALFLRYNLQAFEQLRPLKDSAIGAWFVKPEMYWHKLVFAGQADETDLPGGHVGEGGLQQP